jgi:hypothetical protein
MRSRSGYESIIGFFSSLANGFPDTKADVEARLQELERILSQTQKLRVQLRHHRNSLNFTHRLPPEVLVLVFQYCLPEDVWPQQESPSSPLIYTFSWVCHYWRSTALSAPGLWSAPLFSRPSCASEMLHRARYSSLTVINRRVKGPRVIQTLKTALCSGSRIRHLALCAADSVLPDLIAAFDGPALQLEHLELSIDITQVRNGDLYWEKDNLIGDCAPQLRRLQLVTCMLDPASALYKNLTHLVIDHDIVRQPMDATAAFQILAKACSLESLEIIGIATSYNQLPPEKIVLHKLQHLSLSGDNVHAAASRLLGAVDMRCPSTLCFGERDFATAVEFTSVIRLSGSHAVITKAPPFISLRVSLEESFFVCVEVGTQQDASYLDLSANLEPPRLGFVLVVVCEAIPLQDLRILDVDTWTSESAPTEHEWLGVLGACTALRRISVRSKAVPNFVLALSSRSEGRAAFLCPRWRALVLAKAKLAEPAGDRSILTHVHDFLKARHDNSRPLRRVDFQQCYHPDPGLVQTLAPFAQIIFDGCKEDEVDPERNDDEFT